MKKFQALFITVILSMALAACGDTSAGPNESVNAGLNGEEKQGDKQQSAEHAAAQSVPDDVQLTADETDSAPDSTDVIQDGLQDDFNQEDDEYVGIGNSTEETVVDISTYRAPAEVVEIDLTAEDPSNADIRFVYDELGRVSICYYKINGQVVSVNYNYQDDYVQIFAFMGEFVAADEMIDLPGEFDASEGFSKIDGYYFKGYDF